MPDKFIVSHKTLLNNLDEFNDDGRSHFVKKKYTGAKINLHLQNFAPFCATHSWL